MKKLHLYLISFVALLAAATLGACSDDDKSLDGVFLKTDAAYYSANARGLTYNGQEVVINIASNTYWVVTYDKGSELEEPWFTLSKEAGNGNMALKVDLQRNDGEARTAELKFVTNSKAAATVVLSQAGIGEVIYFFGDSFGEGGAGTSVTEFDGWQTQGMGVEELYYDGVGTRIDAASPSSTYDEASGGNNVLFDADSWLTMGGIDTKGDYNFIFSFGVSSDSSAPQTDKLKLFISQDRTNWTPVEYTLSATDPGEWSMVRVPFFVKEDCKALFFRFESADAGYRIDDPALEEGDGTGKTITFVEDVVTYIKTVLWEDDFSWANNAAYVKSDSWTGADGTRIDKWASYPTSTNGWTIESGRATSYPRSTGAASQTGYLKSGWANGGAGLFSPVLTAVGQETKDVVIELTLATWTMSNKPDNDELKISVLGGGTIGNATDTEKVFRVGSWNEWSIHEFEVFGATSSTQIYIGSTVDANNRWFIDRFRLIYITEKPDDFIPELTVDIPTLEFVTTGDSKTLRVTSNAEWTVGSSAEWLTFSPEGGDAGESTLTVTAAANLTGAEREATVELRIEDEILATVAVSQAGREIEYAPSPANLTAISQDATTLTFAWDEPENSTHKYQTALFVDKTGSPVQQSPEFVLQTKYPTPVFTFGGLEPAKTYFLAVRTVSTTEGVENSPYVFIKSQTTTSKSTSDAILSMHFDRLKWCGDHMLKAYGLRPTTINKDTQPDAVADALTNPNTGGSADVFNTHGSNLPAFLTDRQLDGWYGLRGYEYPGYLKLGTSTQAGFLITPPMSALTAATTLRISFRLGNWNEPNADGSEFTPDKAVIRVGIVPDGVTNDQLKSYANAYTLTQNIIFTADEAPVATTPLTWKEVSFDVPNVVPTDRLIIYATVDGSEVKGKARYELDDIVVRSAAAARDK